MNMGRCVGAGAIAGLLQYRFQAGNAGAFAVGTGDGNHVTPRSREPHTIGDPAAALETQLNLTGMHSGDVLEPGIQGCSVALAHGCFSDFRIRYAGNT